VMKKQKAGVSKVVEDHRDLEIKNFREADP
jgi:hypothetical protein